MSTPTLPERGAATAPATAGATRDRENGTVELVRFLSNPLKYLEALREDPRDVVPFKLGNQPAHLVTKPEYLKLAMENEDWPPISRGRLLGLQKWYTTGLFLTYGPEHHRQRDDVWKPLFEDPQITDIAVERTIRRTEAWRDGQPIELYQELRTLCWAIDWQALTGTDLDEAPDLLEALELGVDALAWLILPFGPARWNWPVPQSKRTREAKRRLDSVIALMIEERRAQLARNGHGAGGGREDLLTQLVRQADAEGSITSTEQVRATFKMWFGADQLHALFVWTLHLLSQNPDAEASWHAELDEVLDGRTPTVDDIRSLPYTVKVIKESMRVIPPVWGFFRQMTEDYQLGEAVIPKGHLMALSPWATHRDPRVWPDPLRFDPERWAPGAERPPELSYFPFSAGPYECHGRGLAMKEAVLILATIGQRWSFRPTTAKEPQPTATWATEPRKGLRMKPVRRG
jgi:cytochrome P450